eukprot:1477855-Rhodomonas_salina.2
MSGANEGLDIVPRICYEMSGTDIRHAATPDCTGARRKRDSRLKTPLMGGGHVGGSRSRDCLPTRLLRDVRY